MVGRIAGPAAAPPDANPWAETKRQLDYEQGPAAVKDTTPSPAAGIAVSCTAIIVAMADFLSPLGLP